MRLKRFTVAAGAKSPWIPLNRRSWGDVGFIVSPQNGALGTYNVEVTENDIQFGEKATLSRVTTVLTIVLPNHGLTTVDGVFITRTNNNDYSGFFEVATIVDLNTITVTVTDSGQDAPTGFVSSVIKNDITGFSAVTGRKAGNIFASVVAVRLDCTLCTVAPTDLYLNQFSGSTA